MSKLNQKLVHSPVTDLLGTPSQKGSPGTYNGEPGLPKRTDSSNAVPEKVYDNSFPKPVDKTVKERY